MVNFFHFDPSRPAAILPPARRQRRGHPPPRTPPGSARARAHSPGHRAAAVVALLLAFFGFRLNDPIVEFPFRQRKPNWTGDS